MSLMRELRWVCTLSVVLFGLFAADATEIGGSTEFAANVLVSAYPDSLRPSDVPGEIQWQDGTRLALDNGIVKADFEDLLNKASILDQVSVRYPKGWPFDVALVAADPGRVRNEAFFRKMYGDSAPSVEAHLIDVAWPAASASGSVRFTTINGAAKALAAVRDEIASLGPEAVRFVSRPNGTFNWRPIAGTQRMSMHSFGAAIDFDLPKGLSRYWRWDSKDARGYPKALLDDATLGAVVCAFEKQGFIWGGKWGHYDTVHFEYRPELLGQNTENNSRLAQKRAER
jgi:hypothetical protein